MNFLLHRYFLYTSFCIVYFIVFPQTTFADIQDPLDPFDRKKENSEEEQDIGKTAEELVEEGRALLIEERLLDGRTKLLKALEKNPKYYEAHMLLSSYYIRHVGHFRLALKYIKQAFNLFTEQHGSPPYKDILIKTKHAHLLYLKSQARLNLDNYQGALDTLDEYSSYGYYQNWYPGSRAWVLMKVGEMEEAVRVARFGLYTGAEPGRTLNMLGILLSMTKKRDESLRVFEEAVRYELSLGANGQPATPLNNAGEVYKEIFREDDAENSWLRATSLPDGCEHVLPSLNLALLYIDQLNFNGSKKALDSFESCVAQFPLRNGEEHRALVHLARGRIALHTGHPTTAIQHFEQALDRRQWFGKIGTNEEDLQAAVLISLGQALRRMRHHRRSMLSTGLHERVLRIRDNLGDWIRSEWLLRRARQILSGELKNFEDLSIRNTDSMIEYPTLGELLRGFPPKIMTARIEEEKKKDSRKETEVFYNAYLAEIRSSFFKKSKKIQALQKTFRKTRERYDDLLRSHILLMLLEQMGERHSSYSSLSHQLFTLYRAGLRNYGLKLPVNGDNSIQKMQSYFSGTPFLLDSNKKQPASIQYRMEKDHHVLEFIAYSGRGRSVRVKGRDFARTLNKLSSAVFTEDLP